MDTLLFSGRSIWTMIHGIVLGGGALMALAAALFALGTAARPARVGELVADDESRHLGWLLVLTAALLWLTVLVGTYVNFPPYRATPPEGITDLARYPRSLIQSSPGTAWLHSFAMEIKEHVPWIAAMLATAVAFAGTRYRAHLLGDARLRRLAMILLAITFALASAVGLLGVFINKVAPLE